MLEGDSPAEERVDLLGADARDGRGLVLWIARGDRDFGAVGTLTGTHELGDVLGERLRSERRLAEDDLADRLVDDLLKAGHVRPLLCGTQVHEAGQPRKEQLVANANDLLDTGDPDT